MKGKSISHFKILEKIGAGGMGEVYLAEDTKLDREVALKFLPLNLKSDPELQARFRQEAKAAAALNHPNIVTVHEIGEFEGQTYIAMEHVEGDTLRTRLKTGALSSEEAIEIIRQVCEGLQKAHEADIIHRDLKPENILIDKDGRVRIVDFGLARLGGATRLTRESSTLGTLHYMSPEHFQALELDHRSDIWAVGVILYEMLTGKVPFEGDYEAAVMYSVLNEEPAPISESDAVVAEQLQPLVSKALVKKPEERYQNVSELAKDLRNLQTGTSVPSTKPAKKKASLVKKVLLGFGGFMLALLGGLAWYIYPFLYVPEPIQKQHDKAIAVLYFDNMSREEDEYFSDGLTEELISRLARIQNLKVASRTDVRIFKSEPASITKIGEELNVDYVVEGSVRKAGDRIRITAQLINTSDGFHRWTETYDRESSDIFAVQDDVANNIAQGLDIEISNSDRSAIAKRPTENLEAYELVLRTKSKLSRLNFSTPTSVFEDIHSMLERAVGLDPSFVDARSALSGSYLVHLDMKKSSVDTQEKDRLLKKALSAAEQTLILDPENELALTIIPIALMIKATGRSGGWKLSDPLLYRRVKIQINRLVELYPESAVANSVIGGYYRRLYRTKLPVNQENVSRMMVSHYNKAIEASERILRATPNDPIALYTVWICYVNMGYYYFDQGRYQEAMYYFNRENEIHKRTGNPAEMLSTERIGWTYEKIGEYDAALVHFERAFEMAIKVDDPDIIYPLHGLSRIYTHKEEYLKALHYGNRRLAIYREEGNKAGQGVVLHALGEIRFLMGDYLEASEYFEKASEIWTDIGDEKQNLWTLSWWSISQLKLGNLEAAKTKAQQTEKIMEETKPHANDVIIVNWNLSQVYAGLGEQEKSEKFLELAHDAVIKKANEFVDSKARETFLNKIRENREVVAAWEKQKP